MRDRQSSLTKTSKLNREKEIEFDNVEKVDLMHFG